MDLGFIGPHTSDDRLSPIFVVCCVRRWGLVVVLPSMHALHVICALLSVIPFGSGGNSRFLDMMAIVLGCACPSLRCHFCSFCCVALNFFLVCFGAVAFLSWGFGCGRAEQCSVSRRAVLGLCKFLGARVELVISFCDAALVLRVYVRAPLAMSEVSWSRRY